MMKIDQIWNEMENDNTVSSGMLLRRYSGVVLPDVFIALKMPEKIRCIAASITNSCLVDISSFSTLRDVQIELVADLQTTAKNTILFKLLNNDHSDIFSVLCEDLMISIAEISDEKKLIQELLNRLEKWKTLFDRATSQGLTSEEQRGLFAEMYLLRKYLCSGRWPYHRIVNSWVGPNKEIKDFQSGGWAIEVKSTSGNNHQKACINSERQLDTNNLENLFLFHLSLEKRHQSGESLNQIIQSIYDILRSDHTSFNRYRSKLLDAGYFSQHLPLYEITGYIIRNETFYCVKNDFPRIEEREIRKGVGDVKYSIILSQCSDFIRPEEQVFELTKF
jgi:hypothetical protein